MSALSNYRSVLSVPGSIFFVPAALARLGVAMLSLAVLWAVQGATGSFAISGLATGIFAAAEALLAPQVARLVDTCGQWVVVRAQLPVFGLAALTVGLATSVGLPTWICLAASGAAGATCPQIGSLAAARWRHLTKGTAHMPTALSLEATVNEIGFMLGPVVVTALSAIVHPTAGLVVAGTLVLSFTTILILRRDSEPPTQPRGPGLVLDRRLLDRSFRPFLLLHGLLGAYFGGISICLTSAALALGAGSLAGVMAAGGGVASLVVGLAYGAASHRVRGAWVMIGGAAVLALACLGLSRLEGLFALVALTVVAGGCIAPIVVPAAVQLQRVIPAPVYVQAITWTGSASALGTAAGAPLIGRLVDWWSPQVGYLALAAVVTLLAAALVRTARLGPASQAQAPSGSSLAEDRHRSTFRRSKNNRF